MLDRIYLSALDSVREGGTPYGMSKWERRAACGRKALVWEEANKYDGRHDPFANVRQFGGPDARMTGTLYHLLHEYADTLPDNVVWDARQLAYTPEMTEALHLYHAYVDAYGSLAQRWALRNIQFEVLLEAPVDLFAGQHVTGRMDAFGFVDELDAKRLGLAGEGHYIVDLKTAGKTGDIYTKKAQARAYLAMARLQYPELKVRGIIFDQVVKGDKPAFFAYVALPQDDDLAYIQGLVAQGARNISVPHGRCNEPHETTYGGCRCANQRGKG